MKPLLAFVTVLLTGLLVGTMFGIWLGYNPATLSGPAYVEVQQNAIRALNLTLPALGAICIVLCLVCAIMTRDARAQALTYVVAAGLLVAAGLITRFLNQPINAIVMTWDPQSPPAEWTLLRDQWWQWHILRTGIALVGFALLVFAAQRKEGQP
jgi:uncharacterized membrane protein